MVGAGARIILFEPREDVLKEAAGQLSDMGGDAKYLGGDVTDPDSVEALADFAWAENGRADIIINNAGVGGPMQSVIDFDLAEARKLFEVNYWGMWHGIQSFGRRMIADGQPGAIYSVASENSLFNAYPFGGGSYVSSKHAIFGLMDMLRREAPENITTGVIMPGWVATDLARNMGMDADEFAERIFPQIAAEEYYVVSHAYNMVRFHERYGELEAAYAKYAPRYDGDDEWDVRLTFEKMQATKD